MSLSSYEPLEPDPPPSPPSSAVPSLVPVAAFAVIVFAAAGVVSWYWMKRREMPPPVGGAAAAAAPADRGRAVYETSCAACHGPAGHGDGPSAAPLDPKPRDFASARWRFGTDPAVVRKATADGVPGTGMPGFANALKPDDLDAVVAYIRAMAPPADETTAAFRKAAALLAPAGFTPAASPWVPPPLQAMDANERTLRLAELKGKLVLVVFWGVKSEPSLKALPALEKLSAEYRGRGLAVVPVCVDEMEPDAAEKAARPHAKELSVYADPSGMLAARYGAKGLPFQVLVDVDGRELGRAAGPIDWTTPAARAMLDGCLPGK